MTPEEAIADLGLALPAPQAAVANYRMTVQSGSLLFVSGHGAFVDGKPFPTGKLGADLDVEQGRAAAEAVTLNLLATLKAELGELSRVARFVKLTVFVSSSPDFTDQPLVANGATDLLVKLFGEAGRPARAAVGAPSLPLNFAVEIDAVVEVGG